ncbi:MAG: hypothetical protein KDA61_03280 [Planctomycetales bacterium]|nr:hypothetical protein [Planctomycetales bacterium]
MLMRIEGVEAPREHAVEAGICLEGLSQCIYERQSAIEADAAEQERLREIGRKLRLTPQARWQRNLERSQAAGVWESAATGPSWNLDQSVNVAAAPVREQVAKRRRPRGKRLSLLLLMGGLCFCAGLSMLAASVVLSSFPSMSSVTTDSLTRVWQWGLTVTIAGEGALILGLTWMAIRLWRNSRRVSHQLDDMEMQIVDLEGATSKLASGRTGWQLHGGAGASPGLALAHLQGQIDRLAIRTR